MDMKKIIPVIVVILVAAIVVISTGAFTSVTAERSAVITVAGDSEALLSIVPTGTPNGKYLKEGDDGAVYLDFADVAAEGVNVNAVTVVNDVFIITNNGTQSVQVVLTKTGDNANKILFGDIESGVTLGVGGTYTVSFEINSYGLSKENNILKTITLTATATGTA